MIALLVALCASPSRAQDDTGDDIPVIIVVGERDVAEARQEVEHALESEGYTLRRQRDDRAVFKSEDTWKPVVVLHDDGSIHLRRRGVVFTPPNGIDDPDTPATAYLQCLLPFFTPFCVRARGLVAGRRYVQGEKKRVVDEVEPELIAWIDAIATRGVGSRVQADLDAIWFDGVAPDGTALATWEERRAAIAELWATRLDNEYGDQARDLIEGFALDHVQNSDHPFTAAELEAVAARTPHRPLELPLREAGRDTQALEETP